MSARKPWSTSVTSEAFTRASVDRKLVLRAIGVMALAPIAVLAIGAVLPIYPLRIDRALLCGERVGNLPAIEQIAARRDLQLAPQGPLDAAQIVPRFLARAVIGNLKLYLFAENAASRIDLINGQFS